MSKLKLTLYHKILMVVYIIAIPIPFGITTIYYVFKLPLRQEKYILLYIAKKLKNFCKKK